LKKGLSILLLTVFLFNVGGYYIVFWSLRFQTDRQLTSRLDANLYDPSETIELKIPVALPYPIQSQGFQRVEGRFEHNGEYFKLIKHRLHNDTLYVVCIRDVETRQLVSAMKDYVQLTQGLLKSSPGQKALHLLSKLLKDFCAHDDMRIMHQDGFTMLIAFSEVAQNALQPIIPIQAPPPRG
jgi:hypothetical protein